MVDECCVVLVTAPSREVADQIATTVVEERLAACCNVVPSITSIYRWKGELCRDDEALLVIKTRRKCFEALRARIVELHSYDVPEVIALPIVDGYAPYLQWISEETSP